ncbi:MAG: class I SAM-dependent methyltransferase [candidate division Zixibacteria bacterium]|nr:class I SAM-dependent methyltransferase [candidate division Zixibacteria bacterium]
MPNGEAKQERVCPWWLGYFLASPIRTWLHDPKKILRPHLREGMTALDIGPGMGHFTLPMAEMVGGGGRVIAVDVQEKMLASLKRRAGRAGVEGRIETRLCSGSSLNIDDLAGKVDFVLTFAVLHEIPDIPRALQSISRTLRPGGTLLIAEPRRPVSEAAFTKTIAAAEAYGLAMVEQPPIRRSRTAVMTKR